MLISKEEEASWWMWISAPYWKTVLYRGDFVHCPKLGELEILRNHVAVVSESLGIIEYIGPEDSDYAQQALGYHKVADIHTIPKGSFFLPTFCDLHLHAPQFLYQGTGLHLPLMQWLNEYAYKAEERIDADPVLATRVYTRLAERLVEQGTGVVLLFGTIGEESNLILARCMQAAGIKAFIGKLSMDKSSQPTYIEKDAKTALANAASFVDKCLSIEEDKKPFRKLIEPVLTPRFVPTCSDELLEGLGKLSESRGLKVQSHMAEAYDQVAWVRGERGMEDIEVFDKNELLTSRTIQAHCTFLGTESLKHVAHRGTSIAHCPLSNAYFSAEPFHLKEALREGVKVGLGTDIAGGYDISIMSAMRQAVTVSRMREGARVMAGQGNDTDLLSIDWKEALYLATTGGAQALGLSTGVFAVGRPFDAQCIQALDERSGRGVGPLDFLDVDADNITRWTLNEESLERWWCK